MKNDNFLKSAPSNSNELPALLTFGAGVFFGYMLWDNLRIVSTGYDIWDEKLPPAFNGFRIVQISDLHGVCFGKRQSTLVRLIEREAPDMIAITGDLMGDTDMSFAFELVSHITKIAPCFYVSGNHEQKSGKYYSTIRPKLVNLGAKVLDDKTVRITKGSAYINVIGLADPRFDRYCSAASITNTKLKYLTAPGFTVLLSHRPELIPVYSKYNVNLALTGHAHGGQFRIPFLHRGIFAPQQMFFPKYTEGIITKKGTKTIVSRGLGTETVIPRFNNPPELVTAVLRRGKGENINYDF